jgi:beta-mannosidase
MRPYQSYGKIGGRFNSEFGMEACPHLSTIDQFISDPKEKYPQSLTMNLHNKAVLHERRMVSYVTENLEIENLTLEVQPSSLGRSEM